MRSTLSAFIILGLIVPTTHAFTAAQSPTLQMLRQEAARDITLAAAGSQTATKKNAGAAYDGSKPVPFHIKTLRPVEFIEVPGVSSGKEVALKKPVQDEQDVAGREKVAKDTGETVVDPKDAPLTTGDGKDGDIPFIGKRIPNLNVVTYVPDLSNRGGETDSPEKGSDWRSWAPKLMLGGGILATILGFFFPPALFLGGALLGAWGMLKLISAKTGGD